MRARLLALLTLPCALASARPASAQDEDPARRATAQSLFDQASVLMDRHAYRVACPKLEEVARLQPGKVGTLLALAECYEGDGRLASAWTEYRLAVDRAHALADAREAKAQAKADALAARLPRLRLRVDAATEGLPGLEVKRDGIGVGAAQWGDALPVDAGEHVLEANATGRAAFRVTVMVGDGETKDIEVTLAPLVLVAAPLVPATPDRPGRAARRTAGLVVGGVGVAGLGAAAVLGIVTLAKSNSANGSTACQGPDSNLDDVNGCNSQRDSARGLQTGAIVAAVAGGVVLGTGVALVITSPRTGDGRAALPWSFAAGLSGASFATRF